MASKLKKMLKSMTVEEVIANSKEIKNLINKVPMDGFFLKDYEINGVLYKREEEFFLLREDKDSYIVEMKKESLHVISLPKELEEKVFVF